MSIFLVHSFIQEINLSTLKETQKKIKTDILSDFRKSLKDAQFDEPVTMYIFRPVAFIFVKLLYKTRIVPNQISFFGIGLGIASSFILATGTKESIPYAVILYFFAIVADNADGMLARLTNKGTPLGRIIDGFSDYVVGIVMYIGMLIAFKRGTLHIDFFSMRPLSILVVSAVSIIAHGIAVDYYRNLFTAFGLGKGESRETENKIYKGKKEILKNQNKHIFEKILILIFAGYYKVQHQFSKKNLSYESAAYFEANKKLIKQWFWIGPAAHAFILILALALQEPVIYFLYTIIIANIYMCIMLIRQIRINRKLLL